MKTDTAKRKTSRFRLHRHAKELLSFLPRSVGKRTKIFPGSILNFTAVDATRYLPGKDTIVDSKNDSLETALHANVNHTHEI